MQIALEAEEIIKAAQRITGSNETTPEKPRLKLNTWKKLLTIRFNQKVLKEAI